jgi:hypothetical protein
VATITITTAVAPSAIRTDRANHFRLSVFIVILLLSIVTATAHRPIIGEETSLTTTSCHLKMKMT